MTVVELWEGIKNGGLPFVFFLILISGYRQMWVWGYLYRAERREKEEWKELALSGTSLARKGAAEAEARKPSRARSRGREAPEETDG